jgi:hypothetical protein
MRSVTLAILSLIAVSLAGCSRELHEGASELHRDYIGPDTTALTEPGPEESARRDCEKRLQAALAEPAVAGTPAIDGDRAMFLSRAKAEPVIFTEAPQYGPEPVSLTVQGYRQMLASGNPYGTVTRILEESAQFPKQARDALLRDGYLYTEDPDLAYALVALVQPQQLFGYDRIWIERGELVLHAERKNGHFYYSDGPQEGERVRLLLFDRAGGEDAPPPPLHRDLRALRYRLHFDRMKLRRVSQDHIVANLHYGKWWVPSVLKTTGAHAELECEVLSPNLRPEVEAFRTEGQRRERVVQVLRRSMLGELDEALPFDEPLHEYGFQLDGTLRSRWLAAYLHHRDKFAFNGDAYRVFDPAGRPLAPQVCVDFLTDTLERTSGTWFKPRGATPGRTIGKLDFDQMGVDRMEMRRVPGFIAFAKGHPEWFDLQDEKSHIELGDRRAFFSYLLDHVDDFAPGDAVLIKGKTPWDANHVHFHSFFIYESDPVTGMPLVLVGNAGRPSLRSWETEIRRTPKRTILHRIRMSTEWLESVIGTDPLNSVPPLAAGPE